MHDPTYRQTLSHSWKLVWHHKSTWALGFLALFLGQFGLSNFLGQLIAKFLSPEKSWWPSSWGVLQITSGEDWFWLSWGGVVILGIILFIAIIASCAQGAIMATAIHWYNTHLILNLKTAWHQGVKRWHSILAINILEKLFLAIILAVTVMVLEARPLTWGGLLVDILTVGLALLAALIVSVTAIYALGYVILERRNVIESVGSGWHLLRRHLLASLEISLILLAYNLVLFIVVIAGTSIVLMPAVLLVTIAGFSGYAQAVIGTAAVAYLILFFIFVAVTGAVFNAFTISAWMYAFMKMEHEGVVSRIIHWGRKFLKV